MLSIDSKRHEPQKIPLETTQWKQRSSNASTNLVGVRDNKNVKVEVNTKLRRGQKCPASLRPWLKYGTLCGGMRRGVRLRCEIGAHVKPWWPAQVH